MILSGEHVQVPIASDVLSTAVNVLRHPFLGMVAHASPVGAEVTRFASDVRRSPHKIIAATCILAKIVSGSSLTLRRLRWCVPRAMRIYLAFRCSSSGQAQKLPCRFCCCRQYPPSSYRSIPTSLTIFTQSIAVSACSRLVKQQSLKCICRQSMMVCPDRNIDGMFTNVFLQSGLRRSHRRF